MKAALRIGLLVALAASVQVGCRSTPSDTDGGGGTDSGNGGDGGGTDARVPDGSRDGGGGGTDGSVGMDGGGGNDGSSGTTYTLADIMNESAPNHPAPGTLLTVSGNLVALSPVGIASVSSTTMNCLWAAWVGTEEGGPYSGIYIIHRTQGVPDDTGQIQCPTDTVIPNLTIGDKITELAGTYTEFCAGRDLDGGTEPCPPGTTFAELEVDTVTVNGTGTEPPPNVVSDISTINGIDGMPGSANEMYESTLVQINDVDVISGPDSRKNFVVAPHGQTTPAITVSYRTFSGLSCLAAGLTAGTRLTSVAGMMEYNFGSWKIHVRRPSDIPSVTTCSASDAGAIDGGNAGDVTIQDIQDETSANHPTPNATVNVTGSLVALTGRGIISVSTSSGNCLYGAWVGDPAGGPYSGILVTHRIAGTPGDGGGIVCPDDPILPSTLSPGTAITSLAGTYVEFCGSSPCPPHSTAAELDATAMTVGGTATVPAPTVITDLSTINGVDQAPASQDNALQGTLVQVDNVDVITAPDSNKNFVVAPHGQTSPTLTISLRQFQGLSCLIPSLTAGTQLTSITGVLEYNFGVWKIHVRQPSDIPSVTCLTDGGAGPG